MTTQPSKTSKTSKTAKQLDVAAPARSTDAADLAQRFATLAPAREDTSVANLPDHLPHFIAGAFTDGTGARFEGINPATGEPIYTAAEATTAEVDAAVAAATAAQAGWAALSGTERGKYLYRIARMVAEQSRRLAVVETLDGGKPIRETRDVDVPLAAQHLFHYAGWADKLDTAGLGPNPGPIGVAGQIIPWNFPLLMAAWKIAPALATGNTVVLKPAESTPASAHLLARICADAGLPAGVVNIVNGAGATGAALVNHPGLDKIAFTGSTDVGRAIATALAGSNRRLTLELGGKGALIVFEDAALDAAVEGVVRGIFFNQGHVCCAGSRLLVHESIHDEFLERLRVRAERIIVGDPMDKNTELGAINSAEQRNKIAGLVDIALAEGATRLSINCTLPDRGFYFPPTVLDRVAPADTVARTEVFGPVLAVHTFRTVDEAVAMANNTPYGLAAGVFTQHPDRAHLVASRLDVGVVWVNTYNVFDPTIAFGGRKESGFGREGSMAGLEAYCG
jgi:aldehyde dehydrogenase (NAD+)